MRGKGNESGSAAPAQFRKLTEVVHVLEVRAPARVLSRQRAIVKVAARAVRGVRSKGRVKKKAGCAGEGRPRLGSTRTLPGQ